MTNSDIYELVFDIVNTVTGLTEIYPANDNTKKPDVTYAAINVNTAKRQKGQANVNTSNTAPVSSPIGNVNDVNYDIRPQVIHDVIINFYRTGANELAASLFQANKRPDIQVMLWDKSVGWQGCGPVNDLTGLQSEKYEERAQVTIRLMYELTPNLDWNAIYQVPIEVQESDGGVIFSGTIQAPTEP